MQKGRHAAIDPLEEYMLHTYFSHEFRFLADHNHKDQSADARSAIAAVLVVTTENVGVTDCAGSVRC